MILELRTQIAKKQSAYFKALKKGIQNEQTETVPDILRTEYVQAIGLIDEKIEFGDQSYSLVFFLLFLNSIKLIKFT